jgi:hypothetical protein
MHKVQRTLNLFVDINVDVRYIAIIA